MSSNQELIDAYPAEVAELVLEGLGTERYDFEAQLMQKVLVRRLDMKERVGPQARKFLESTATWLTKGRRQQQNVRLYGQTGTALLRIKINRKEVELLLRFLGELTGWKGE